MMDDALVRHAQQPESRMSDARLAEIQGSLAMGCAGHEESDGFISSCVCFEDVAMELIAEVRRLRRENHLLHLSRGSADEPLIGMD